MMIVMMMMVRGIWSKYIMAMMMVVVMVAMVMMIVMMIVMLIFCYARAAE